MIATPNDIATTLIKAFRAGRKLLICGNGGSAADAQHIAAEFVGRYKRDRRALPAIALASDVAVITAIANDYGFDNVFARQVEALGRPGDVLLAISTSGGSLNIHVALREAFLIGMVTVGFTGTRGVAMCDLCDMVIVIDSDDTAAIQQGYMVEAHKICGLVEDAFCTEV